MKQLIIFLLLTVGCSTIVGFALAHFANFLIRIAAARKIETVSDPDTAVAVPSNEAATAAAAGGKRY